MKPIECPQCGAPLDPDKADADSRIQCSQCGRRLRLARKRDLQRAGEPPAANTPPSVAADSSAPPLTLPNPPLPNPPLPNPPLPNPPPPASPPRPRTTRELLPPPSRTPVAGRAEADPFPVVGGEPRLERAIGNEAVPLVTGELRATKSADEVLREAARRKQLRQRWSAAGLTLLLAACGVALYLLANPPKLVIATGKETEVTAAESGEKAAQPVIAPKADNPAAAEPLLDKLPAETVAVANEDAESAAAIAPPAWGELRTVGRRDLEKLWAEIHPYIFRLTARKPTGERVLSGVLVDSRGWVVTSLSAIEGASSIVVWPAPADPLLESAAENLRDEVRGVVAVDRARDLVLLQINRKLVNVVTPLQPTDKLLVPGKTLIQAASVGPERLAWLTEARIARSDPAALPAEIKQAIERRGIDLAPYWPGHALPLSQGVGAALFTPDGKLAGVNTGLSAAGTHYFAEAKWLSALVQSAREPAAPLSNLGQFGLAGEQAAATGPAGTTDSALSPGTANDIAGDSPFPAGHEAEPVARRLAETGQACAAFGWLPDQTAEAQAALTAALLAWREARGLVRSRRLFPEDSTKLSNQLAHWTGQIKSAVLGLDRNLSAEFNRRAWESLTGDTTEARALFVRVVLQPGTSPRAGGADTATLELIGLQQFVVATVEADIAPLLPESEWLVVVTLDPKEETLVSPEPGQQALARRGMQLREISEVKSIGLKLETPPPSEGDGGE